MHEDPTPIRRCVCIDKTFAELKQLAAERGLRTVGALLRASGAAAGCGLCRPYLQRMLETGETEFPILSDSESAPM